MRDCGRGRAGYWLWLSLFFCSSLLSIHTNVHALQGVALTDTPEWVERYPAVLPEPVPVEEAIGGEYYLLVDQQTRAVDTLQNFFHYAVVALNTQGVESVAQISVTYDPTYEHLQLHDIYVHRNGQLLDRLHSADIKLMQRESELDAQIYDGRITANIILSDVRVGDVIEYSYSIIGQNPVYQNIFADRLELQWSVPVFQQYFRLIRPKDKPLNTLPVNTSLALEKRELGDFIEYRLTQQKISALTRESETPGWYNPYPRIYLSELQSWQQVAEWARPHYQLPAELSPGIKDLHNQIMQASDSSEASVVKALHYVQSEVRYLGIEIGVSSHVPSPPEATFNRRFGDCKDKTMLLLALLKLQGIEAYPALVHSRYRHTIANYLPTPNAFNHVIVYAKVNNKGYWLDPTLLYQLGSLHSLYQPDYGMALILREGEQTLTAFETKPHAKKEVKERIDLSGGVGEPATYRIETQYFGKDAEDFRAYLALSGKQKIQQEYINYYSKFYPSIQPLSPLMINNENADFIVTEEFYVIPDYWRSDEETNRTETYFYSNALYPYVIKPKIIRRSAPLGLAYPVDVKQSIEVLLPFAWQVETDEYNNDNRFFLYSDRVSYDNASNTLLLDYQYKSKVSFIPPDNLSEYLDFIKQIDKRLDYYIYHQYEQEGITPAITVDQQSWSGKWHLIIIAALTLVFAAFTYAGIEYSYDRKLRSHLYVVSFIKFMTLTVCTFNLYCLYWYWANRRILMGDKGYARALLMVLLLPVTLPFLYYSAFCARHHKYPFYGLMLGTGFFVLLTSFWWLPAPWNMTALLAGVCLLPLVKQVNSYVRFFESNARNDHEWRARHVLLTVVSCFAIIYQLATYLSFMPSSEVIAGDQLWKKDLKFMHRNGLLRSDEKLLYFYSDGLFSFQEDGNAVTNQRVLSYWRDDLTQQLNVETAGFNDIINIDVDRQLLKDNTIITVTRTDGSQFILFVSQKGRKDQFFTQKLLTLWEGERQTSL
ncbi:DUF3857 domain-containing transglutaminase family protein [Zooshikella ganghwensis]|uniref:DUF3857 domain-containing transglutaminase family protein n=1 Tax=Zooshikella ganghwensis TaxID=202772 RepID=UPI00040D1FE3|nr:DUF3857 domain-containing protein [Zooshikella ganghwensis]